MVHDQPISSNEGTRRQWVAEGRRWLRRHPRLETKYIIVEPIDQKLATYRKQKTDFRRSEIIINVAWSAGKATHAERVRNIPTGSPCSNCLQDLDCAIKLMHMLESDGIILGGSNNEIPLAVCAEKHLILPRTLRLEWRSNDDDHDRLIPATLRR